MEMPDPTPPRDLMTHCRTCGECLSAFDLYDRWVHIEPRQVLGGGQECFRCKGLPIPQPSQFCGVCGSNKGTEPDAATGQYPNTPCRHCLAKGLP